MVSAENDPCRAGTIWMLNLDEPVPVIYPLLTATFRRVDTDLLHALISTMSRDDLAKLLQRFETGRRCYTAWVGDQLVSYGWVSLDEEQIGADMDNQPPQRGIAQAGFHHVADLVMSRFDPSPGVGAGTVRHSSMIGTRFGNQSHQLTLSRAVLRRGLNG